MFSEKCGGICGQGKSITSLALWQMRTLIWFITSYKQLHLDKTTVFGDLFNLLMFHIGSKCLQWGNDKWVPGTSLTWLTLQNGELGVMEVCLMETLLPGDKDNKTQSAAAEMRLFCRFAHLHTSQCFFCYVNYHLYPNGPSLWTGFIFGLTRLSLQFCNALGSGLFHFRKQKPFCSFKKRFK